MELDPAPLWWQLFSIAFWIYCGILGGKIAIWLDRRKRKKG